MSAFYDDMAATADELLREYGKPLVLRRVTPGAYDPSSGAAAETTVDFPGTGTMFDFALQSAGQAFAGATMIETGDKQCYLSPVGAPLPMAGDLVVDGADAWQVKNVKAVNPAGTPVLYELHLRR